MNRKIESSGITLMFCLALTAASGNSVFAAEETAMATVRSEICHYDQEGNEISRTVSEIDSRRLSDSLVSIVTRNDVDERKSRTKYREDGSWSTVSFSIAEPVPSVFYTEYDAEGECMTQYYLNSAMMNILLFDYEDDGDPNQRIMSLCQYQYTDSGAEEVTFDERLEQLYRFEDTAILQNTYDAEGRLTEQVKLSESGTEQQRRLITYEESGDTEIRTITDILSSGQTVTIQERIPVSDLPPETVSADELMEGIWIGPPDEMREEILQVENPEEFLYSRTAFLIDAENSQCLWYDGGEFLPVRWEADGMGCVLLNEDTTGGQIAGEYALQYDADTDTIRIFDLEDETDQTRSLTRW